MPFDESIYIAFRGSGSIENWETDLDTRKIFYYSYPECHCEVHEGFYAAQQRVFPYVLNAVSNLTSAFPSYTLKVTGYSLGAALAHLTAMDLVKYGMKTSVYNFGMPRIGIAVPRSRSFYICHHIDIFNLTGDARFAAFASAKLTTWRITHDKVLARGSVVLCVIETVNVDTGQNTSLSFTSAGIRPRMSRSLRR